MGATLVAWSALGAVLVPPRPVGAQGSTPRHPVIVEQFTPAPSTSRSLVKTPLDQRLATITTDTGDLRPGHTDLSNYRVPGLCLSGAQNNAKTALRTEGVQAADTAHYTWADTLPASTVAFARECGKRFVLESTAPEDLDDLFELRLFAMDDTGAATIAAKRLATPTTIADRRRVIGQMLHGYLYAKPTRLAAAESLVAEVDRRYAGEPITRVMANGALLVYARNSADVKLIRRAAEAMLAAWAPVVRNNTVLVTNGYEVDASFSLVDVYSQLIAAAILDGDTAAVLRVVKRARADIGDARLHAPGLLGPPPPDIIRGGGIDTIPGALVWGGLRKYLAEDPPTSMKTAHWFAPDPRDTVVPAPGKVVLVISTATLCSYNHSGAFQCERLYDLLRRLNARYAAAGLKIVIRTPVDGYSTPREVGMVTAGEEAKEKWAYYHDEHKLPIVALALDSIPVHREPNPDGRVRMWDNPSDPNPYESTAIIGRDGRTLFECTPDDWYSQLFLAFIDRAMRGSATSLHDPAAVNTK